MNVTTRPSRELHGLFDVERIRADFTILKQKIRGKDLVFLDSAASAQKALPEPEEARLSVIQERSFGRSGELLDSFPQGRMGAQAGTEGGHMGLDGVNSGAQVRGAADRLQVLHDGHGIAGRI